MLHRTCVLVAWLVAGVLLGASCVSCTAPSPSNSLPHGGSAPAPGSQSLSDAQISAWLTAIQRYYQQAAAETVPQSALRACYLLTSRQVDADLSHPAQPWYVQGPLLGSPPRVDPSSLECVISAPGKGVSLGTAYGDAGASVRIHTAASHVRATAQPHRDIAIPGTGWFMEYSAWHLRQPTDAEIEWVVDDVMHNLAAPPPEQPPAAFLPGH